MEKPIPLSERLKTMSTEDLLQYRMSAVIISFIAGVIGVASIFLALIFTNVFMLISVFIIIRTVGTMAVETDMAKHQIDSLLAIKNKADK